MRFSFVCIATVALVSAPASAQLFQPFGVTPTGSWPEAVATGDLNGDGLVDVVVSTSFYFEPGNDHSIHVFPGQPGGTLGAKVTYPAGNRPQGMDVGDVTGDGRDDVVVANFQDNTIGVFAQDGTGVLAPMQTFSVAQGPEAVVIADLDNDGRSDIAVSHWNTQVLGVFVQNAAGGLDPMVSYPVTTGGRGNMAVGDLNGDGLTDLVHMSGQSFVPNLSIFYQDATGVLGTPASYSLPGNTLTSGVTVGDLNGDGRDDIACSYGGNRPSSGVAVWYQNAQGTLDAAVQRAAYDIPEPIVAADVTGDGLDDLVVVHGGWLRFSVYAQDSAGSLSAYSLYPIPYASHYNRQGLKVEDMNRDGLPEVLIADYNAGLVQLRHRNMPFAISEGVVSAAAGADVEFYLNRPGSGGALYALLPTLSGTSPGTQWGSLSIPINFDPLTFAGVTPGFSSIFQGFVGRLDDQGFARARFDTPLPPGLSGATAHFAYVLWDPLTYASSPLGVRIFD